MARMLVPIVTLTAALFAGCSGDSTSITGAVTPPPPAEDPDLPSIPRPSAPAGDTPSRSETYVDIRPVIGDFTPYILAAPNQRVTYSGEHVGDYCSTPTTFSGAHTGLLNLAWFGQAVSQVVTNSCGVPVQEAIAIRWADDNGYPALVKDGDLATPTGSCRTRNDTDGAVYLYDGETVTDFTWTWTRLQKLPHIKRERTWVIAPFPGGATSIAVEGAGERTVTSRYTVGTSRTDTESFGRTVTGGVGLELGPLSVGVSAELSEAFETAVTVSEEREEEESTTIAGQTGVVRDARAWILEEVYSFVDENGEPFTDPNYTFANITNLTIRGAKYRLIVTDFPR